MELQKMGIAWSGETTKEEILENFTASEVKNFEKRIDEMVFEEKLDIMRDVRERLELRLIIVDVEKFKDFWGLGEETKLPCSLNKYIEFTFSTYFSEYGMVFRERNLLNEEESEKGMLKIMEEFEPGFSLKKMFTTDDIEGKIIEEIDDKMNEISEMFNEKNRNRRMIAFHSKAGLDMIQNKLEIKSE